MTGRYADKNDQESHGLPGMDILWQDLRFAFRGLRRDRGFAAIAILILALGIGANVAVFSVVDTMLLRPLPFANPEQLAWLSGNNGAGGLSDTTFRVDAYEEFRQHSRSFQNVTAYVPFLAYSHYKLTGQGEPKPVSGLWVAGDFFHTLGIQPALGRLFSPEESVKGGRSAVLLSYAFWQTQFNSDPAIVGRTIALNNTQSVTVVGVLPAAFDFGAVFAPGAKLDFFRALPVDYVRNAGHILALIGRLKPGVTLAEAQAESNVLFPQLRPNGHPGWATDVNTIIAGLKDHTIGKLRRSLIALWFAVDLVLLIVCVNLSNLLLARAAARGKEFAMRSALGAGRVRLIRQLLTESLVLSGAGAALGLAIAFDTVSYLAHQGSITLPLLSEARVDGTAILWTLAIAVSTALIFGIVPSFKIAGPALQEALKDGGHGMSNGRNRQRMRSVLVISEIALACVLLVGAGLLLRSFLRVLDVDLGFLPTHAASIKVDYDDGENAARRSAILQEVLSRVTAIPGIEAAGMSDKLPLDLNRSWEFRAKGAIPAADKDYGAFVYIVTPGYIQAMGMHLRAGRDFSWQDSSDREHVIIINEAAANREWPGQDPIGRIAQGIGNGDSRVIGVISDVRESSVESASSPQVLAPITQQLPEGADLVVRTTLPPDVLAASVLGTLRSINPGQTAYEFRAIQQIVDHAISPRRFFVQLVGIFAGLGLLLASLGIYGVISYSVTQRTHEIGIRMALGATRTRVQMGVIAGTLKLALIGIGAGILASFVAARAIATLLFGIEPTDPSTFTGMIFLLTGVALLAAYIPARRAAKVDPMVALRYE